MRTPFASHPLRKSLVALTGLTLTTLLAAPTAASVGPKPSSKLPSANLPSAGGSGGLPTSPHPIEPNTPNLPGPAPAIDPDAFDNWGFELGLTGWTKTGNAFNDQPTWGDNVLAHRVMNSSTSNKMPLGGDYWKQLAFPVNHKGVRWIGTYEKRPNQNVKPGTIAGDARTGSLTSKPFRVEDKYITFLIGGGNDKNNLRVELLEKSATGNLSFPDGKYSVVPGTAKTGRNHEPMRREWWSTNALLGKTVRIRIVDNATGGWGHINVDDFQFQDKSPHLTRVRVGGKMIKQVNHHTFRKGDASTLGWVDWDAPVWGVADLHTHPGSHLGFGGKLLHGAPDGDMSKELANCNCTHGGWGVDNECGNYIRMAVVSMTDGIYKYNADLDHQHSGAERNYHYWPHFTTITHQQMRYEWIKRAHEGGLRVMVGLAVNNHLLAEVLDGDKPKDDKSSADLQIKYMRKFAARHKNFMEIAESPAELRDIVRRGKLALVLGIEVDNIGNFNFGGGAGATASKIRSEIRRLHGMGVRYIFPIHVTDNPLGGAAVYEDMFNYANRFNSTAPLPPNIAGAAQGVSFQVETAPDRMVSARLGLPLDNVWAVGIRTAVEAIEGIPTPILGIPVKEFLRGEREYQVLKHFFLSPDMSTEAYKLIKGGHRNRRGLSSKGEIAVKEMMRLGMIIDIDHMSEKTVADTLKLAEAVTGGYPLVSGHNTFRAMGAKGHTSENQRTDQHAERLVNLGGMMGVGWGYVKENGDYPSFKKVIARRGGQGWTHSDIAADCGGSSKRFAQNYLYALEKMAGSFVGLGTDINGLVPGPGPRFGRDNRYDGNQCGSQHKPVAYESSGRPRVRAATPGGSSAPPPEPANAPLKPERNGRRVWNINRDGVAHYGMLPDFFQDLSNVGLDPRDMTPLFLSAEHFAQTWDKALEVAP